MLCPRGESAGCVLSEPGEPHDAVTGCSADSGDPPDLTQPQEEGNKEENAGDKLER